MHARRTYLALAVAAALVARPLPAQETPAGQRLVLTGVTVVDVREGRLLPDRTVVVVGDRIVAVGAGDPTPVPAGARVVDARGGYLIPGLWDMHVHSAVAATREFPLYLALGITGVRNMHATPDTALALVRALRTQVAAGTLLGPRFLANGAVVDGPEPAQPGSVAVGTAAAARSAVDSLVAGGADFIKVYVRLPRDAYFGVAAQAKALGIPFVGHVPIAIRAEEAADAGQRSIEHTHELDWSCSTHGDSIRAAFLADPTPDRTTYRRARAALTATWDGPHCAAAITALKRNATWFVPTLVVAWAPLAGDTVLGDSAAAAVVPVALVERWRSGERALPTEARGVAESGLRSGLALVQLLHAAGVPLLAGTDVGNPFVVPGYSLHTELALLVRAGLSPLAALQAATLNPARFLAATDSLGTVEPGRLADLVLLDGDPLADIRNTTRIRAVITNGRYLDRSTLDALLAEAGRAANPGDGAKP
jgi:imidazolonepropionase-like amidohydrolase